LSAGGRGCGSELSGKSSVQSAPDKWQTGGCRCRARVGWWILRCRDGGKLYGFELLDTFSFQPSPDYGWQDFEHNPARIWRRTPGSYAWRWLGQDCLARLLSYLSVKPTSEWISCSNAPCCWSPSSSPASPDRTTGSPGRVRGGLRYILPAGVLRYWSP